MSDAASLAKPPRHIGVTPLYRAICRALQQRIIEVNVTLEECDDLAGVQDGYTAKMLNPDTFSGRQGWQTIQWLVDALYPGGVKVMLLPGSQEDQQIIHRRVRKRREAIGALSSMG